MSHTINDLLRKQHELKEAIKNVNLALESKEYAEEFKHSFDNQLKAEDFKHTCIKRVLEECHNRKMGFDPDLLIQHTESEIHRQFNKLVEENVKDSSIESLFALKHEMELFLLKDRAARYPKRLAEIELELKKIDDALNADPHEELPIETKKKSKKK